MAVLAGRSFWARTSTAITDIQVTLMTPSAASAAAIAAVLAAAKVVVNP